MDHSPLVERVRSEFIEMPGLRLTPAQAARLWGMDDASCHHVISALVRAAFLRWTAAGWSCGRRGKAEGSGIGIRGSGY